MPKTLTILLAKTVLKLEHLLGKGGSALPGLVAERLDPQILAKLIRDNFTDGVIIITGTNGKTTTATLTAAILRISGRSVVHNNGGSNLMRGVISALLAASNLHGQIGEQMAVFEVDENAFPAVARAVRPRLVAITNLFRDQLDRYGELDATADKLRRGLQHTKANLLLNADDPLVATLGSARPSSAVYYFGVNDKHSTQLDDQLSADSVVSPEGEELVYSRRYYSHLGIYRAKRGDFARPEPNFEATAVKLADDGLCFGFRNTRSLADTKNRHILSLQTNLIGFYNVYNALAAAAVVSLCGVDEEPTKHGLLETRPAFGRVEKIRYQDRDFYLLLVKNPVGFNQILETFVLARPDVPVLIVINDNFADSRDVSWLWDVSFEALANQNSKRKQPILVSGLRAADMTLRLKYANVDKFTIINQPSRALHELIALTPVGGKALIIPTYTAMLALRSQLAKLAGVGEYWQ